MRDGGLVGEDAKGEHVKGYGFERRVDNRVGVEVDEGVEVVLLEAVIIRNDDVVTVNPQILRSRIPTFILFTLVISIALCIFFVLSFLFTTHSYSSHQLHLVASLYFYLILNPFYVFFSLL